MIIPFIYYSNFLKEKVASLPRQYFLLTSSFRSFELLPLFWKSQSIKVIVPCILLSFKDSVSYELREPFESTDKTFWRFIFCLTHAIGATLYRGLHLFPSLFDTWGKYCMDQWCAWLLFGSTLDPVDPTIPHHNNISYKHKYIYIHLTVDIIYY